MRSRCGVPLDMDLLWSRGARVLLPPGGRRFGVLSRTRNHQTDQLPFNPRRHSETFGQLVRSDRLQKDGHLAGDSGRVFGAENAHVVHSPFRDDSGRLFKGQNAQEARLHDATLAGRVDHHATQLPHHIADTINDDILVHTAPDRLREKAALIYQALGKDQILKAPETALEADAHIAALFLQDYAHARQVLLELQKRTAGFCPKRVLEVGYGPAVGMVALNELMGNDYKPDETESYIVGRRNSEMKKRAKIILCRQASEAAGLKEEQAEREGAGNVGTEGGAGECQNEGDASPDAQTAAQATESSPVSETADFSDHAEHSVGPVDTTALHIRTKLRDTLPLAKQYDLIIVSRALLTREYSFPKDIDINIHSLLRLVAPNGHLVLIERGNALGFETIARARQVMLRPESYPEERGKIPRPYIKGSSVKPQRLRNEDQLVSDEDIAYEEELLAEMEEEERRELAGEQHDDMAEDAQFTANGEEDNLTHLTENGAISEFEQKIIDEHGEATEDELRFEFEESGAYELTSADSQPPAPEKPGHLDYHIRVVAPCAHHKKCPLQLGDPKYYKIPSHKHRFNFCSFSKTIERPRFTMELKKGRRLATTWDKNADDGFGLDGLSRKTRRDLLGSGRPGGNNSEVGNYSYLIVERTANDESTVRKIEADRLNPATVDTADLSQWPRIIDNPLKVKNNVRMNVCAPSGNIETWQIPKSLGKQEYHDARKAERGDLWALGRKSSVAKKSISEETRKKLEVLARTQKKSFLKEERKKQWKKLVSSSEAAFDPVDELADELASQMEATKKYRSESKRFDVDVGRYEGR